MNFKIMVTFKHPCTTRTSETVIKHFDTMQE